MSAVDSNDVKWVLLDEVGADFDEKVYFVRPWSFTMPFAVELGIFASSFSYEAMRLGPFLDGRKDFLTWSYHIGYPGES